MAIGTIVVDFSKVRERSAISPRRVDSGPYLAKVKGVTQEKSKAGDDQLVFLLALTHDPTAVYPYYCPMHQKNDKDVMWKLYELLRACGFPVKIGGKAKFTVEKIIGKQCVIVLEDDEYNGRDKSTIGTVMALAGEVTLDTLINGHAGSRANGTARPKGGVAATEEAADEEVQEEEFSELDIDEL